MSGKDFNYANPAKDAWRERQWNEIKKRIKVRPHYATVLYLAASTDFDSIEAVRRGFINENLIAVDADESVVKKLRASGRLAIQGDFCDVLMAWPDEVPLHVVVPDFCCGLTDKTLAGLARALVGPRAVQNTVVACNLLRGRDKSELRENLVSKFETVLSRAWGVKHRGAQFVAWHMNNVAALVQSNAPERINCILEPNGGVRLDSYKSGVQYFDSVVFNNCAKVLDYANIMLPDRDARLAAACAIHPALPKTKARIAATLAHRTRRMQARFA